jgi:hypothetical protein
MGFIVNPILNFAMIPCLASSYKPCLIKAAFIFVIPVTGLSDALTSYIDISSR